MFILADKLIGIGSIKVLRTQIMFVHVQAHNICDLFAQWGLIHASGFVILKRHNFINLCKLALEFLCNDRKGKSCYQISKL